MDDTLLTVLVVGAAVAFFFIRNWRRHSAEPASHAIREPVPPPPPPAVQSEEERLAQEAADVQARWDSEREAIEDAHDDEMWSIREKLEKAKQLIEKSGVGDAACDVLRIMWHWPSWSKRDDWKMPVALDGLDGGKVARNEFGGREGTWLGWNWDGEAYRLELTVSPNYTSADFDTGDLKLSVGDEPVMHLDVSQRLGDEYDKWRVFGVSAFKAGPWMAKLNELAGQLRIADRQWFRDHEKSFYGEKAGKIQLD